jgi:hypothetical protein
MPGVTVKVSYQIPRELWAEITRLATRQGLTKEQVVIDALTEYYERRKKA